MTGEIRVSDVRWLGKLLDRLVERADAAHPLDAVTLRLTTTELARAKRLARTFGWHDQHERLARSNVSRGTQTQPQDHRTTTPAPETAR